MQKLSEEKLALGFIAALAVWTLVALPIIYLHDDTNPFIAFWRWTSRDAVAFYTLVLGLSTIGLWLVTARGVRNQTRDTQILQRAYISVEPEGITPHYNKGDRVVGRVIFRNVGHLPARNVRWYGNMDKRGFRFNHDDQSFPLDEPFEGKIVLPPGMETSIEIGVVTTEILGSEAYLWGIVLYEDGFGIARYTKFCHRYRTRHLTAETFNVSGREAALHRHGNDAN
jgi:hypothetical protein